MEWGWSSGCEESQTSEEEDAEEAAEGERMRCRPLAFETRRGEECLPV